MLFLRFTMVLITCFVIVMNLQCREIAVNSHNEMTKVATELHSVSNYYYYEVRTQSTQTDRQTDEQREIE